MKVEPKRVKKIPSPVLFIGLGGTGCDALLTIMDKFNRRYELPVTANGDVLDTPERTAYLAFDADHAELSSKKLGNMRFAQGNMFVLSMPHAVGAGVRPAYISSWLDNRLTGFKIENGCGGIRQAGRYVFFHNADGIYNKLNTVIHSLLATPAGGTMGTLEIVMTAGVSGGTGSGTFMDMAYMVHHVMRTQYPAVDYKFMAYIMMPPVNVSKISVALDPGKKKLLEATGFAALKELDFWMNYNTHQYEYTQKYSETITIAWNRQPFDYVVLMGDKTVNGDIIENAYQNCLDVLSESVVNFFAHEQAGVGDSITLRSHLVNVAAQESYLAKKFPANYTYMTVGAAVSDAQQDEMVTYESKLVFDRIKELSTIDSISTAGSRHAAPLLNKHEGEEFLEKFLPASTDYFSEFTGIMPDLNIFSDPNWSPQTVYESSPVHDGFYKDWCREVALEAEKFAVEKVKQLRSCFYEQVEAYATDLTYGPFVVTDFLKDANQGFLWFFNNMVDNFGSQEHSIQIERDNSYTDVSSVLYPQMRSLSQVARLAGFWGPARRYFERCAGLFAVERDYELAKYMARELRGLQNEIKAYVESVLPVFCKLLLQVGENVDRDMMSIDMEGDTGDIATAAQLKAYIDKAFGNPEQETLSVQVIRCMIRMTQQVEMDNMGTIMGLGDMRKSFLNAADQFVLQATSMINGVNMDQLINIKMPEATEQEKKDFVAQNVLGHLDRAARTMLPLFETDKTSGQYIPYAYVSVPENATLIMNGVTQYQQMNSLTPKLSDVSDMIFWLNTYNCVPMCMYTDLARLEKVYDEALFTTDVNALHLVQTVPESGDHMLRYDWSLLPSPVVHKLQNLKASEVLATRQRKIAEMLEQALTNRAATLTVVNGKEQLKLRLRMENGVLETMDQFQRKLTAITGNSALTPEQKIEALNALAEEGVIITKEYKSFTEYFADAEGLVLTVDVATNEAMQKAAENREKARRMAAAYILYAWYPQIAEQMVTQQEMFRKLIEAIKEQEALIEGAAGLQKFVNRFLLLYLSDIFVKGRTSVKFKNFRDEEEDLIAKTSFTDDELTVYSDFCDALVLLSVLGNSNDSRIDSHNRQYLMDKGAELEKAIDRMSDEDYAVLQKKAKAFYADHERTADAIHYDKGSMPVPVREQMIRLLEMLRKASRLYA